MCAHANRFDLMCVKFPIRNEPTKESKTISFWEQTVARCGMRICRDDDNLIMCTE